VLAGWLENLAPGDLVAAVLDIVLGLAAAAWLVVTRLRSSHRRSQDGPAK
jgi:hypothetical protein